MGWSSHDYYRYFSLLYLTMKQKKQFKLGDAIAKLAKILHIPHCLKCEKRRLILNEVRTLGVKETINKLKDCC